MAKTKSRTEQSNEAADGPDKLGNVLSGKWSASKNSMRMYHDGWEDKESMITLQLRDRMGKAGEYRSSVNDGRLSTIVWDRAARVMAQIPRGQVRALTKADKGKSALMDLALWRYIIPNANAQFDHLVKLRLWNFYSAVYGTMPMLYYWRVSDNYVGPDCYLVPIRNFFPQPGRNSIEEMDWCMISTMKTVGELKALANDKTNTWNTEAIRRIVKKAEKGAGKKRDTNQMSLIEQNKQSQEETEKGDFAQIEVVTCYESGSDGHWISFCPDYDDEDGGIIRDVPNQHKNGKIPIILKHCFPLIDSIMGLGDFERGKTIQFAMNSLTNLFLDTMKMQLYKPIKVNVSEVVPSSIRYQPGAIWRVKSPNAIQEMDFSPNGLNTFQSTYQFLSGALQNQNGTSMVDTTSTNAADPTLGKTPEGIKAMGQRESARDNWDRFLMEKCVGELYEAFVNMLAKQQNGRDAIFHIFDKEVEKIKETADSKDVVEFFDSGKAAKVKLGSSKLKDTEYAFLIDNGSTKKEDQKEAMANLTQLMSVLPNLGEKLNEIDEKVNWGELIKQLIINSGVDGWEKIIVPDEEAEQKRQQAQQAQDKGMDYSNMDYKSAPEDAKRMWEARELGQPAQEPSPVEKKLQIDAEKLELAKRKQQFQEQKAAAEHALKETDAEIERNRSDQQQVAGGPNPGYAEAGPEDDLVAWADRISGYGQQPQQMPPGGPGQISPEAEEMARRHMGGGMNG